MNKRMDGPRWQMRFETRIRYAGDQFAGVMTNISNEGMEVRGPHRLNINDEVTVRILTPLGESFHYLSKVRWWRPTISRKMSKGFYRYGLRHMAVDPNHDRLLEMVKHDLSRRNDSRVEVELSVFVSSNPELGTLVTENISAGGVFLRTDDLPPPYRDERLSLSINMPGFSEPFKADARVVHLVQPSWAEKLGMAPGVGLRFMNLSNHARDQLQAYLKKTQEGREREKEQARDETAPGRVTEKPETIEEESAGSSPERDGDKAP